MNATNNPVPDPMQRIAELEAELARVKEDRDMQKMTLYKLVQIPPEWEKPMTLDEVHEMMNTPNAGSIEDIIAEIDRELNSRESS